MDKFSCVRLSATFCMLRASPFIWAPIMGSGSQSNRVDILCEWSQFSQKMKQGCELQQHSHCGSSELILAGPRQYNPEVRPSAKVTAEVSLFQLRQEQGEGRQRTEASWKWRDQIQRMFSWAVLSIGRENKGTQQRRSCDKFHQKHWVKYSPRILSLLEVGAELKTIKSHASMQMHKLLQASGVNPLSSYVAPRN